MLGLLGGVRAYLALAAVVAVLVAAAGVAFLWTRYDAARVENGQLRAQLAATDAAFADYRREVKAQIVEVERLNVKREVVYVETQGVQETIIREVPAVVEGYPALPPDLRVLHDAAAAGCSAPPDDPAARRDAAPVDLETFASTVIENYCTAERNRQQVIRLQRYIREREQQTE